MKIGWIETVNRRFGGTIYDKMVQGVISKRFDVEVINIGFKNFKKWMYLCVLYRLHKINGEKDVWVRQFHSVITMPYDKTKGRSIVLIHHIDMSTKTKHIQIVTPLLERIFYRNLKKVDAIITVSKYWRDHFLEKGYSNVHMIYNAFDVAQFNFSEELYLKRAEKFEVTTAKNESEVAKIIGDYLRR